MILVFGTHDIIDIITMYAWNLSYCIPIYFIYE